MSELIANRAFRIKTLKEIIKHLHEGQAPKQAKDQLRQLVREVDADEIAAMEQELIAEGMPVEEVQSMCDLHSEVLREVLVERQETPLPPGHPLDQFHRENEALTEVVNEARTVLTDIENLPDEAPPAEVLQRLRSLLNDLRQVDKHYARKENLLFSCLERHGVSGPSKVMWGKDDEVRDLLKTVEEALTAQEGTAAEWKLVASELVTPTLAAVEEMIYKEEKILLPMSKTTLTEQEWAEIWRQSPEYGWCLVEPQGGYVPPEPVAAEHPIEIPATGDMVFPTGSLNREQLLGIFSALPLDLTFIDREDCVRYFSEGPERVFPRSPAIIGRKVQHCHPPASVGVVEQILRDFKSGRQNVAEFWIQHQGKFVHIRYFAVRSESGDYLGTLEVTQDLTAIRQLEGERRLLEYPSSDGGQS